MENTENKQTIEEMKLHTKLESIAVSANAYEDLKNAVSMQELLDGKFAYRLDGEIFGSMESLIEYGIRKGNRNAYIKSQNEIDLANAATANTSQDMKNTFKETIQSLTYDENGFNQTLYNQNKDRIAAIMSGSQEYKNEIESVSDDIQARIKK